MTDLTEEATSIFSRDELVKWCLLAKMRVKDDDGKRQLIDRLRIQIIRYRMWDWPDYQDFIDVLRMRQTEVVHSLSSFEIPDCFGHTNGGLACLECVLYNLCTQQLVNKLPECYGILYQAHTKCDTCMVNLHCSYQTNYKPKLLNQVWKLQEWPILDNILKSLALFRSKFKAWPLRFEMYKYNRLPEMVIRKANMRRVTTVRKGTPWDMWVMYAGESDHYPYQREPIVFEGERTPVNVQSNNG